MTGKWILGLAALSLVCTTACSRKGTTAGPQGGDTGLIERTWTLGSWDYPANVDLENPWPPLPADAVHGDSKEVHLEVRIIKLNVDH